MPKITPLDHYLLDFREKPLSIPRLSQGKVQGVYSCASLVWLFMLQGRHPFDGYGLCDPGDSRPRDATASLSISSKVASTVCIPNLFLFQPET